MLLDIRKEKIMKKIFALVTAAVLMFTLTACDRETEEERKSRFREEYSQFLDRLREEKENFPKTVSLPDGTSAQKSEVKFPALDGVPQDADSPYLDYAFIRYAEPFFETTFDSPEKFDISAGSLEEKPEFDFSCWIKVKSGDVLENGWKIISARSYCDNYDQGENTETAKIYNCELKFDGEITLDGVLEYYNGSSIYGGGDYYLYFYPDTTKYKIPVAYGDYGSYREKNAPSARVDRLTGDDYIAYDGSPFYLFGFKSDIKSQLTKDLSCKAAMTFENVVLRGLQFDGNAISADF